MDRSRKRTTRLVVSLTIAVMLALALVYTSFSAASTAREPSELVGADPEKTYQVTGRVSAGSWKTEGLVHTFQVEDRDGSGPKISVRYEGQVPDPFREGREIIIDVRRSGSGYIGEPDTLITKCPSKFEEEKHEPQ